MCFQQPFGLDPRGVRVARQEEMNRLADFDVYAEVPEEEAESMIVDCRWVDNLKPGGIFSFTREIPDHGPLSVLLHPHHNGYHLTHHLFPAVPYHQLPRLHAQLMELDEYDDRAFVCHAYLNGSPSGVAGWGAHHG